MASLAAALLSALLPAIGFAQHPCLLVQLPLPQRTEAATLIAEGKVVAQQSFWDDARQNIYTSNTVEVYKLFKGNLESTLVEVITEGGSIGETLHVLSSTLRLRVGQQGVLFLQPARSRLSIPGNARPAYEVYSSLQGFIRYDLATKTAHSPFDTFHSIPTDLYETLGQNTGTRFQVLQPNPEVLSRPALQETTAVQDAQAVPVISGFSPTSIQAGNRQVITINGLNFGSSRGQGAVGFRSADDGGRTFINPLPADYVSWTDTQIRVRVPTSGVDGGTAGSGQIQVTNNNGERMVSASSLNVVFALSNLEHEERPYLPDLVNDNGTGGYTFRFSQTFHNNMTARNAFTRALTTWSCATGVNWVVGQPVATAASAEDGINIVRFDAGPELPAGVLGRTISRYRGCSIGGSELNWYVEEIDMEFDGEANWQFGPARPSSAQFDYETIALHELGHAHQLSHIILPRAVMHYGASRAQTSRQLSPENDIAGAQIIVANSVVSNSCGPTRMIPAPATNCNLFVTQLALRARFVTGTGVLLEWTTATEQNSAFFIVERSPDGVAWEEIGRVAGAGTSQTPQTYQAVDTRPFPGISYYRLRITNTAGVFGFSEVVQVIGREIAGLSLFPNPVPVEGTNVQGAFFLAGEEGSLTLRLYDNAGRLLHTHSQSLTQGLNFFPIPLPNLSSGLYHLRWDNGTSTGSSKLVKL